MAVAQLLLSRGAKMEARDELSAVDQIFHHYLIRMTGLGHSSPCGNLVQEIRARLLPAGSRG